jgi:putative methionine-R-sulfoxide reductase with GAF domain
MPSAGPNLRLRQQLSRRLVPLALLIGSLISLGGPAAYYRLEADLLAGRAAADAQKMAERLGHLLVGTPALWKYQVPKYRQLVDEFAGRHRTISIQVLDASGAAVPEYQYQIAISNNTWTAPVSSGTAPLFVNNQRMGSVSVAISQASLLWTTLQLFLLSTCAGVSLGLVVWWYPVRVVTSVESRTDELVDALAEQGRQIEAVRAVTEAMTREPDLTNMLTLITQHAVELVGATSGVVRLWDEEAQRLIPAAWLGVGEWIRARRLRLGEGISGKVAQRREGLIVNDYQTSPHAGSPITERAGITAILAEPLLYRDRLLGVFTVDHEEIGRGFTERDRDILRPFVAQATIAVEAARVRVAAVARSE